MKVLSKTAFRNPFVLASIAVLGFLAASSLTLAQTTPVVPAVPKKLAPATAKPATAVKPAAATAKPVAAKQLAAPVQAAPSNGQSSIGSASGGATAITNQGLQPASLVSPLTSQTNSNPAGTVSSALASTGSTSTGSTATGSTATGSTPGDPRAPVAGQGVGTLLWPGGWTLTAYGCFRTGTRLFCDFDTTNQNNLSANTTIWSGAGGVNLVDDGGKITQRHNAFFVGQDGSQFQTAYISPQPVRFIIEYDDVDPRYTSASLVLVRERIQGVPITAIDPSQPAGTMPARVAASAPASGTQGAQPASGDALGKATNAVNNVSEQKKKAQGLWQSVQGAVQPH
jgi:hypothetical protein